MTKHIESMVPQVPVRDADRARAQHSTDRQPTAHTAGLLVPVHRIPGLRPDERVAELRLRVRSGVYGRPEVVEQVARAMQTRGF